MTDPRYDVIAIGNAIVDVISPCEDALLEEFEMPKGGMTLIDTAQAGTLYDAMGPAREISGGSAANTLAGFAMLGGQCALIGQVADDQLGEVFAHDIRAVGVDFDTVPLTDSEPTGRCLIFVTPDGQRTMNTFLGASSLLAPDAFTDDEVVSGGILYLEGYQWTAEAPRAAMHKAIPLAKAAGRKIALTLSDNFVIDVAGDELNALMDQGMVDIIFANEDELAAMSGEAEFDAGLAKLGERVPLVVATRSEKGAVALHKGERAEVPAEPVVQVLDTTGAGDLFAAGFLYGHTRGEDLQTCLKRGAIAAAEIISHYGARPEADLQALMAECLD